MDGDGKVPVSLLSILFTVSLHQTCFRKGNDRRVFLKHLFTVSCFCAHDRSCVMCHIPYNLTIIHSHLTPTSDIISDTSPTLLIINLSSQQFIFHTPHYHTTVSMLHYYYDTSDPHAHFLLVSLLSTPHLFFMNPMCFLLVT